MNHLVHEMMFRTGLVSEAARKVRGPKVRGPPRIFSRRMKDDSVFIGTESHGGSVSCKFTTSSRQHSVLELLSCYHKTLGFVAQGRLMGYTQFRTESLRG